MENTNWQKQTLDKPLFEDILWSRPEHRARAGKLLIVGGSAHGFAAPAQAYSAALSAGIGSTKVLLPDATQKIIGKGVFEADFAPGTPSGSFSRQALAGLLDNAAWADGVLLAGDFGRNSETAILLESFAQKYKGQLTLSGDAVDYFINSGSPLLSRYNAVITAELGQLQKLAKNNRPSTPILYKMNLHELVTVLADWTNSSPIAFITNHAGNLVLAHQGRVSTTKHNKETNWEIELAAYASVWWLQQPDKPFEALTTAVFQYLQTK